MFHDEDTYFWFEVLIKTNARQNQFSIENGIAVLKIKAIPIKGKANRIIVKYLAKILELKSKQVQILRGTRSRTKHIAIYTMEFDKVKTKILRYQQVQRKQ